MGRLVARIANECRDLGDAWHRFWFSETDPTVLCVMRMLVGGMVTYTVFVWGLKFDAFLGERAWNSPALLSELQNPGIAPSFWWYVPETWHMPVHWLCVATCAMFAVGLVTRATSILTMIILISYSYRAHMANYGLDQINAILTFYLCLAPCGDRFSLDSLIRKRWRDGRPSSVQPSVSANLATRMIQVHFCIIYSFAGLAKLQGDGWWNGEAIWMALANTEYQTIDMTWIAWYPWISDFATHGSMLFELSFWALVWGRMRPLVLLVAALLHLSIGAMMGMWTFAFIMIFGHLSFWSPNVINYLIGRLTGSGLREEPERSGVTVTIPLSQNKPETTTEEQPRLVCLDTNQAALLRSVRYFNSRGFRCYATNNEDEAVVLCEALQPAAVIVVGRSLESGSLPHFDTRLQHAAAQTGVFYMLSDGEADEFATVLTRSVIQIVPDTESLGELRRTIERTRLTHWRPAEAPVLVRSNDHDGLEEEGPCESAVPNKPR